MAKTGKPNSVVIMGDDIGWQNSSCYHRGMMSYWTPNIDCIANERALFTDWYWIPILIAFMPLFAG